MTGMHPVPAAFLSCICALGMIPGYSAELTPYNDEQHSFLLNDLSDTTHRLEDYAGKVVLINFWASWCPPCIYEMPDMIKLKQQLADKPFEILALNVGEKKYKVRKFVKLINYDLPVLLDTDSQAFNDWGAITLPTSFLVDAKGQIRYTVRGNPGWNQNETLSTIQKLITDAPATTTKTAN